ncbi:relaxase/mobilization nuclease domain-containing protein, partial [Tenacibaculum ovolyticum]|uniref:relaxase/mobilization nuclease domain-containing protein n=1 Tax=Tenacibaculum ovolyticum TaxID=104270 RepID=UPI0012FB09E8
AIISSGSDVKGMVYYNSEKEKVKNKSKIRKENTMSGKLLYVSNIFNSSRDTIVKTLESYNKQNKIVKKPNIHISLNFHKNDNLTDSKLIKIANDYMNLLGYGEQPFAIFRHYDRDHHHIHITSTRINAKGKKINDSFEKYKSMAITEKLEKKYDLIIAKNSNSQEEILNINKSIHNYVNNGDGSLVNIISNA